MKYRTRTYYTDSQKALMWERWKQGQTLHQIAGLFDRAHGSIRQILAETGGIRPPERHRSRLALTLAEREEISRAVVAGFSIRTIAMILGRAPSTVSREIKRKRWSRMPSSDPGRPGSLGPGPSPQELQAGCSHSSARGATDAGVASVVTKNDLGRSRP